LSLEAVSDELPTHQISRVQDGKSGNSVEARGRHVEVVADPNHVRVGVVGVQNRVAVAAVAVIGDPGVGRGVRHESYYPAERRSKFHSRPLALPLVQEPLQGILTSAPGSRFTSRSVLRSGTRPDRRRTPRS